MSSDASTTVQEDLAFLRALVERRGSAAGAWAEGYFGAGLIYGAQMLMHAAQLFGWLPGAGVWALAIGIGPTLVFIPTVIWIGWRRRGEAPPGAAGRAIAAVFGAVGLANLALIVVIGVSALRERSLAIWLIYPACVFILQGAAWMVAFAMRRRAWLALVAAGWLGFAIAMGLTTTQIGLYVLFCGLGIWLNMALPGWIMLRQATKQA
ncbi:MAG TPA: hypothetical protein VMT68_06435 [Caulobacteraceae bacterium]|nr:hypothetical protein [Caulobacteraceae bacterium]